MCVAIFKPPGKIIPKETLRLCFERNADGAGFMYPLEGKVIVVKGLFTFAAFWKAYKEHVLATHAGVGAVIHFRIGTSGKKNEVNCHPHVVAEDLAFVHNGILSSYAKSQSEFSDTIHFRDEIIKPIYDVMGQEMFRNPAVRTLVEDHITTSKMIFLSGSGFAWMLNKRLGTEIDGVWYSNTIWQPYVAPKEPWRDRNTNFSGKQHASFRGGCYLESVWHDWKAYRETFPDWNGPFESDYLLYGPLEPQPPRGYLTNRKGQYYDPILKAWVEDKKKEPDCTDDSCKGDSDTGKTHIGSEIDDQGNVIVKDDVVPLEDLGYGSGYGDIFPETRCINCLKELNKDELESQDHLCTECMISITNPSE